MYSKWIRTHVFLLSLVMMISACGVKVGEAPSSPEKINLAGTDIGCLENAPESISAYFRGKSPDSEVVKIFECADKALDTFSTMTQGAQKGLYNRQELENFLERYFLNGRKLGASFYESGFEFKVAVIGGDALNITKKELDQAREFLMLMKSQIVRLRPLFPLTDLVGQKRSFEELDQASLIFSDIGAKIGSFLEKTGEGYSFTQLDRALVEIQKLLPTLSVNRYRESIEMLKLWKTTFVSPSVDEISKREWSRILFEGAQWYFLLAKFEQLSVNTSSHLCGRGRDRAVQLLKESAVVMEHSLALKGSAMLGFHELDRFIDLIPEGTLMLKKPTIKDLVRTVTQKILRNLRAQTLNPPSLGSSSPGLTILDIRGLLNLIEEWNLGQTYIESLFANKSLSCDLNKKWDKQFTSALASRDDLINGFENFVKSKDLTALEIKKLKGFRSLLMFSPPLWEAESATIVLGNSQRRGYSFLELSARNTFRSVLGAVFEGYGKDRVSDGRATRLTKAEMQDFYLDIRNVGIELNLMDSRLWNWADYRFRESNVFTFNGNGDDKVNLHELIDLVVELVSAKGMGDATLQEAAKRCKVMGLDIFGKEIVEEKCFFAYLKIRLGTNLMQAPNWVKDYRNLSEAQKNETVQFFRALILPNNKTGVESAYTDVLGGVFHFEELVLEKYDTNRSGGLDESEALSMFPQFKNILKDASGLETDSDLEAVLTYTLANGEPPTKTIGGIASFLWWKTTRPFWSFHAPRLNLIKVFSVFASSPYK